MNINTSDLNFKGRYLLKGKNEQVNRAMNTIKQVKGDDVEFLPIACGNNKLAIVATQDDVQLLKEAKKYPGLPVSVKKICSDKESFLPKLFNFLFKTDANALIIEGDNLSRFALPTNTIDYNNGATISKYKSAEHYIDGTIKKYTLRGRLCEIIRPDKTKEEIDMDGTRTITSPDGSVKVILSKARKQKQKALESSIISQNTPKKSEKSIVSDAKEKRETIKLSIAASEVRRMPEIVKFIETKPQTEPVKSENKTFDSKGRIKKVILENGVEANHFYKDNSDELLFIHYSDGKFRSTNGEVDEAKQTITFPYRDGIRQVLDNEERLVSFIFPDGVVKNYDNHQNLTEKVYPNGKIELFNKEGKMYLIIHEDGTKQYPRRSM